MVTSEPYLRLRCWVEFLLLQPIAWGMASIAELPLPSPLGAWQAPEVRVGAFLPLLEVIAIGMLLHSRWSHDYEEAVTAQSTVASRALVLTIAATVVLLPWAVIMAKDPPLPFIAMTLGWMALGAGLLLLCRTILGKAPAILLPAVVVTALAAAGWFPSANTILGDPLGSGRPIWAAVIDLLALVLGVAAHVRRGR